MNFIEKLLDLFSFYNHFYTEPSIESKLTDIELRKLKYKFKIFSSMLLSCLVFTGFCSFVFYGFSIMVIKPLFLPIMVLSSIFSIALVGLYLHNKKIKNENIKFFDLFLLIFFGLPMMFIYIVFIMFVLYGRSKIVLTKEVNGHIVKISINCQEYQYNKDGLLSSEDLNLAVKKNYKGTYGGIKMYEGDYYYKGVKCKNVLLNKEKLEILKKEINKNILLNKVINF